MGIDLLNNNNSRYFSVPDHADLTFPDSDWFIAMWTNVNNNDGTQFEYLFSNNSFAAANSLNIFIVEDAQAVVADRGKWRLRTVTVTPAANTSTGADDTNRLIVVQRNSGNIEMWFAELGQTATKEVDEIYSDGTINGGTWNIGRRTDGNSVRYYENHFGDVVKGSVALTQAQIELLALGVSPTLVTDYSNLDVWFQFRENAATVVDLINGHVATRQGTGLVTVEHFPVVSGSFAYIPTAGVAPTGRIMSSLAASGGLAYHGGIAGRGGGLAG